MSNAHELHEIETLKSVTINVQPNNGEKSL